MKFLKKNEPTRLFSFLQNFLQRTGIVKKENFFQQHALAFHNVTQFLGALNDNLFKFLTVYLLINIEGVERASVILFWVGTVYVLPFLLFSSTAGVLADKFSKQRLIIALKFMEIVIMLLGVLAYSFKAPWAAYTLLFFLSFQSAFFSPPKYSIIPEIVKQGSISKANGIITAFTYLAIILGTFFASAITQVTSKNFIIGAFFCVFIAICGFISSLFIPHTMARGTKKTISPLFIRDIYRTLISCRSQPNLLLAIIASAFFLYVGAFFQLNVIPFAIKSLNLSEVGGGYLFLLTAIGIAVGAYLGGRLSKKQIEIGLALLAGLLMAAFLLFLSIFSFSLYTTIPFLILIGFFGGLFVIPFDSYIQTYSPDRRRGQVIAASTFLSFCGVLLAPFTLYLLSGVLKFSAAEGFAVMAIIVLFLVLFLVRNFPGVFFNYLCRKFLHPSNSVSLIGYSAEKKAPLVFFLTTPTVRQTLLLYGSYPSVRFFVPKMKRRWWDFVYRFFTSIAIYYPGNNEEKILDRFLELVEKRNNKREIACLILPDFSLFESDNAQAIIAERQRNRYFTHKFVHFHTTLSSTKKIGFMPVRDVAITLTEGPEERPIQKEGLFTRFLKF